MNTSFPIQGLEEFGNVQIESMICETPVLLLIEGGVPGSNFKQLSGFLVKDGVLKNG